MWVLPNVFILSYPVWFIVPSMALIFCASSREELALVRLITAPVVPLPMLFDVEFSDCALLIPTVAPIIKTDDNIKIQRNFIINKLTINYKIV